MCHIEPAKSADGLRERLSPRRARGETEVVDGGAEQGPGAWFRLLRQGEHVQFVLRAEAAHEVEQERDDPLCPAPVHAAGHDPGDPHRLLRCDNTS